MRIVDRDAFVRYAKRARVKAAEVELRAAAEALDNIDVEPRGLSTVERIQPRNGTSERPYKVKRHVRLPSAIWARYMEAYWNWIDARRGLGT